MWNNLSFWNLSAGGAVYRINTLTNLSSSQNNTDSEDSGYSLAESIAIGTILTSFIILAVVGNILVCIAVFTDRHLRRNSNFFLVSLAIADLLMAVLVMTFAVANDIHGKWVFGSVFCNFWISSDIMCSTASILNLCAISLDRYIHIRDPLRYENWMTTCKTGILITFVWVMSIIISFIPIHLKWHKNPNESNLPDSEDMCNFELNPIYAVVSSTISFYIPTIVMLAIYCQLYLYARRHVASIRKTYTSERLHTPNSNSKSGTTRVSDHKAAVTLGIIMGVFLLCWMPFFIFNLIAAFCKCVSPMLFKILTWLGYVNSCLNPIIYSIFNQEFREAFRKILFPKSCRCGKHDSILTNTRSVKKSIDQSETYLHTLENGNHLDCKEPLYAEKITNL